MKFLMTKFISAAKIKPPYKALLLFGPTAVGKTAIIEELFPDIGEVINADSMQVYKEIAIGTAKPEQSLIEKVPHHLVDYLTLKEQFEMGTFVRESDKLIPEILFRGKIPVISGGTAFYFKHLIFGLPSVPPIDPIVREEVNQKLLSEGLPSLYKQLQSLDPIRANQLHATDKARILRSLEVCFQTGEKHSDFALPTSPRDFIDPLVIGLTRERSELYSRINRRVDIMINEGLYEEWKEAVRNGATVDDPGMRGIGYREFFALNKETPSSLESVKEEIKKNTRRYAKRQLTFFRSIPGVEWFTLNENNLPETEKTVASIKERIKNFFS